MKVYNVIYIAIYIFFKKVANKYTFDSPEGYTIGLLSLLLAITIDVPYYYLLGNTSLYTKGGSIGAFVITLILSIYLQCRYYIIKDNHKVIYSKNKTKVLWGYIGLIIWLLLIVVKENMQL